MSGWEMGEEGRKEGMHKDHVRVSTPQKHFRKNASAAARKKPAVVT